MANNPSRQINLLYDALSDVFEQFAMYFSETDAVIFESEVSGFYCYLLITKSVALTFYWLKIAKYGTVKGNRRLLPISVAIFCAISG